MFTVIKTKEGDTLKFLTQWYDGLGSTYVAIHVNGASLPQQGSSNKTEPDYHKYIRMNAIKCGDKILNGSIIELKRKCKYDINKFEGENNEAESE